MFCLDLNSAKLTFKIKFNTVWFLQYGTVPVSMGLSVTAIGFLIDVPTI